MSVTTLPARWKPTSRGLQGPPFGFATACYNIGMTSPAALCVYCREKPAEPETRPFCSKRCRLLDLGRWVDGDYRVAGDPVDSHTDTDELNYSSPRSED